MGTKRVGLARTQALIQNLKRELDMNSSQLRAVQQVGQSPDKDSYGVYDAVFETDFGGYTATATDDGLQKTVATLPATARILSCHIICSEVFSDNNTNLTDLVLTATTLTADVEVTPTLTILDGIDLGSASNGSLGVITGASFAGTSSDYVGDGTTGTQLCWINKGAGNGTTAKTSGKIVVYIKYIASGGCSALTTF
tara:strand:+ start:1660 stop:2250 length:591 start_codon:yes stop_codon:yes gene_type:complete